MNKCFYLICVDNYDNAVVTKYKLRYTEFIYKLLRKIDGLSVDILNDKNGDVYDVYNLKTLMVGLGMIIKTPDNMYDYDVDIVYSEFKHCAVDHVDQNDCIAGVFWVNLKYS